MVAVLRAVDKTSFSHISDHATMVISGSSTYFAVRPFYSPPVVMLIGFVQAILPTLTIVIVRSKQSLETNGVASSGNRDKSEHITTIRFGEGPIATSTSDSTHSRSVEGVNDIVHASKEEHGSHEAV